MGIMLKARKFLNRKILLQLYHSFVYPYLIYCLEIWGNAADIHIYPIIKLQNKIVRIMTYSRYGTPTKPIFTKLNILPFKRLVVHRIALQMYKYNNGLFPIALETLFSKNCNYHNYNTRNKDKLRPPTSRHAYRDKDFSFISVHIWNYVSDNVNVNLSFPLFKKSLKYFVNSENYKFTR